MERDKVESLLGFAIKAGKIIFGADTLLTYSKKVYLVFLDKSLAENSVKRVVDWANKNNRIIIIPEKELESLVFRKNCKVIGLTDRQMAEAIQKNLNTNYKQYVAEGKEF